MKKQVFYKTCKSKERGLYFEKDEGYIYSFKDVCGHDVQVAIGYHRSARAYFATEVTTGLSSYPLTGKTKEELLDKLSKHDFKRILNSEQNIIVAKLLKAHIESEATNEQTDL